MDTRGQSADNPIRLAWLAGFIDGEGCISMVKRNMKYRPPRKTHLMLQPSIQLSNTNKNTMEMIYEQLHQLGIGAWMRHPIPKKIHHKTVATLHVVGQKRVKKFLDIITPYLYTKQKQAKLLLEFVNSRQERTQGSDYNTREFEIVDELTRLNQRGVSEAIR